jgi:NADPH:quinone reductase-like Zn-dependent oxidoreductase
MQVLVIARVKSEFSIEQVLPFVSAEAGKAWEFYAQPIIDRVFPFDEAPAAYHHLLSGSHFGKVVIRL